ncbi:MAG: ABC transporter ATP-binding protein [Rhodospirillaceae bacterium]|nr:ABC transporter ATP-binding protein [Rhodospirillaceae bacterium]
MNDAGTAILEVEDVHKSFGGLRAVAGASLAVRRGSLTALIGPNGAGKTTLFDLITGFAAPDRGAVRFEGRMIAGWAPHRIARLGLVRTFQLTRVFAAMSVIDNMMLAAPDQPGESLLGLLNPAARVRAREAAVRARAMALLARFGLDGKAGDYAGTLSGGQRKLLELARALMVEPRLVLLDEPMAGINPVLGRRLLDDVEALRRDAGMTFLFVEHDMDVVMTRADHVIVMAEGAVIADGPPEVIRTEARVIDAYLGQPRGRT